jgi:hypothetical protein
LEPAKLKVVELKAELTSRGISIKGKKAVLVAALEDALAREQQGEVVAKGPDPVEEEVAAALVAIEEPTPSDDISAANAADDATAEDLDVKFGGVLPAGSVPASSKRVPTREGVRPGEGSTKIPGTQRLARDSGTHEFFGAVVRPASDPHSRKVKLNRPGITKSGRKWRQVKTKR